MNTKKIIGRMQELNLTQKHVAELLGIKQPTLSQKIYGLRPMYVEEAEKMQKILEINDKDFTSYFLRDDCVVEPRKEVIECKQQKPISI